MERRARDLLAEVAQESRRARTGDDVLAVATELVRDALRAESLALLVKDDEGHFRCGPRPELGLDRRAFVARRLERLNAPLRLQPRDLDAWESALKEEGIPAPEARRAEIETLRQLEATMIAPVTLKGDFLGLLVAGPRRDGRPYREEDGELAMAVAVQMALVLENARLLKRVARQERIERDLQMAALVQERLLPAKAPDVEGLDVFGVCLPARGVAGDWFDFLETSDGGLAITIADVAGKGMPAALLTSGLRAAVRSSARSHESTPARILQSANEALLESGDGASYATIFQARFGAGGGRLTYANAGHHPPLLIRADGRVDMLAGGGTVAGLFADRTFETHAAELQAGDVVVAYTDGLSEAGDPAGEEYGVARLVDLARRARGLSARALAERVVTDVRAFTRGALLADDLTLVVVRRR